MYKRFLNRNSSKISSGFTLVELVISIGIFAFMTGVLLSKYGNFNKGIILTNLAYDIAVNIRTAQTYGLNTKGINTNGGFSFNVPYGMYFTLSNPKEFVFYSDNNDNGQYTPSVSQDESIKKFIIKNGMNITALCAGNSTSDCSSNRNRLDILFRRPDPKAIINHDSACSSCSYARITITAPNGENRYIEVRSTGQISIKDQ